MSTSELHQRKHTGGVTSQYPLIINTPSKKLSKIIIHKILAVGIESPNGSRIPVTRSLLIRFGIVS